MLVIQVDNKAFNWLYNLQHIFPSYACLAAEIPWPVQSVVVHDVHVMFLVDWKKQDVTFFQIIVPHFAHVCCFQLLSPSPRGRWGLVLFLREMN